MVDEGELEAARLKAAMAASEGQLALEVRRDPVAPPMHRCPLCQHTHFVRRPRSGDQEAGR